MFAPPTNGYRILIYGQDSTLLETRRLLLASTGFRVDTVSDLHQFRAKVGRAQPSYELIILCHTIPREEQERIGSIARRSDIGLYRVELMEPPPQFLDSVSGMMSNS